MTSLIWRQGIDTGVVRKMGRALKFIGEIASLKLARFLYLKDNISLVK